MSSKYSAELFLEACGRAGPLQLAVDDAARPGAVRRVFHQPFLVVGRDPDVDLLLDNWRVSKRHAYLQLVGGRLFCLDLGSRTGVQWSDGDPASNWLDPGRSLRVGPYELRLSAPVVPNNGHAAENGHALPARRDFRGEVYRIESTSQNTAIHPVRVDQDLALVGSASACQIRLPYPDVSKAHCSLIRTPLGVWAVDLLGRGGIHVNENQVRFARLDDGDELRLGRHVLRLRLGDPNARTSPPALPHIVDSTPPALRRRPRRASPPRPPALPVSSPSPTPPALPTESTAIVPTWQYPDGEVRRLLDDHNGSQAELIGQLMQPMVEQFGLMQQQMFEQFHHAMMGMFQQFGTLYRDQMTDLRDELDEVRRLTRELQGLRDQAKTPVPASEPRRPAPVQAEPTMPDEEPIIRRPPTRTDPGVHGVLFDRIASLQAERQTRWQKILGMLNRSGG